MKILGVDYGRRRIGLAVTDESGQYIRGCPTLDKKINPDIEAKLLEIILEENPAALVFGLPLDSYDQETNMSIEVHDFVTAFKQKLIVPIPIHFVDESYSSHKADQYLMTKKKKHRRKKNNRDQIAACYILESFIMEQNSV